jgi:hypothetical protein
MTYTREQLVAEQERLYKEIPKVDSRVYMDIISPALTSLQERFNRLHKAEHQADLLGFEVR